MTDFYADTYAIFAFLKGDARYARRFRAARFRTGILNVLEVRDVHLRFAVAAEEIERNLAPFEEASLGLDLATVARAAGLRAEVEARAHGFSLVDAVALAQARAERLPLLTGDARFRGLAGVEFLAAGAEPRAP